jgi:hypothetical protein
MKKAVLWLFAAAVLLLAAGNQEVIQNVQDDRNDPPKPVEING